jgi:hypothetical protein
MASPHAVAIMLAQAVGLSQSAVVRRVLIEQVRGGPIWHALALQPHRSETFKLSRDPLFTDKMRDRLPSNSVRWDPILSGPI